MAVLEDARIDFARGEVELILCNLLDVDRMNGEKDGREERKAGSVGKTNQQQQHEAGIESMEKRVRRVVTTGSETPDCVLERVAQ